MGTDDLSWNAEESGGCRQQIINGVSGIAQLLATVHSHILGILYTVALFVQLPGPDT